MIKIKHLHNNTTRFFTQHDHGLLSGEVAHAFIDPVSKERLSMPLVMAIAAHDLGWDRMDAFGALAPDDIPYDAKRGVHDFLTISYDHKLPLYLDGIERCEALHPYAGLLISLHYTAFLDAEKYADVIAAEEARRTRLATQLGLSGTRAADVLEDYERLKFFDLISLYVCMRAPEHDATTCPDWIAHTLQLLGHSYDLGWCDASTLTMDPFPFAGPVRLSLPYRDLPVQALSNVRSFQQAWREAEIEQWEFWIKCAAEEESEFLFFFVSVGEKTNAPV